MNALPASPTSRARCVKCALPLRTCVCALVARVGNRVDVLVLQHPGEEREAKGSARLMALSLARCRVVVGEAFEPAVLRTLLQPGSVLLYPAETNAAPAAADAGTTTQLVVLDGTWRKSLRMLRSNPLLHDLPRWSLAAPPPGRYGALRKARRAGQLSTLEATCAALSALEADDARYAPLLDAFDRFVADRVARTCRA
ncbi:MAG: tRNA-uridine aminocarboxypropyltransferase [Betaproteobacteria bacterium]